MLRASLQQWQSLSCASVVIVRQRDQKERSGASVALLARGCLGSNPRGQVVVGAAGHHALVVF